LWPKYRNKKIVQNHLRKLEKDDKGFFDLVEGIRKCVNEKNLKCFNEKSDISDREKLDSEILEWSMANDKILCEKLEHHFDAYNEKVTSQIKEKKFLGKYIRKY